MATIQSTASGYWDVGATWVGGTAPGVNDRAQVRATHLVTVRNQTPVNSIYMNGGKLCINNHILFSDASPIGGFHFLFDATPTNQVYSTAATPDSLLYLKSASTTPTYPVTFMIENTTGPELRLFNLDYFTLQNIRPFIGNTALYRHCNNPAVENSVWIDAVSPLLRASDLKQHKIQGRDHGRVYREGEYAGAVMVSGHCNWDSHFATIVKNMQKSGNRIGVVWDRVQVPFARIEGEPKFNVRLGSLWTDFTIVLVEDW